MGEKATLRMARQELEDLYLGVPDNSVDLTFRDLLPPADGVANYAAAAGDERNSKALLRSSTNIFTYKIEESLGEDVGRAAGLELPPSNSNSPAALGLENKKKKKKKKQQDPAIHVASCRAANYKRPGVAHSNICTLCTNYVYIFRHRCLVCGRVYCRRCVGAGMGDMTEGRKCIDCLGRRYSHRYIHRAGSLCRCLWGYIYYPNASTVKAQELVWAEKGPAPRRRPPSSSTSTSTSISTASYAGAGGASMSMTMMSTNNSMMMTINAPPPAPASSSFVASFSPNPHAFPL